MTDEQIKRLRELAETAKVALRSACANGFQLRASIPAEPNDHDLVIGDALHAIPALLDELSRLRRIEAAAEACVSYFVPVRDAVIADLKAALEGK